ASPGSHCSPHTACTVPSPQASGAHLQSSSQATPVVSAGSHCSSHSICTRPSPQESAHSLWQVALQPSPDSALPSSQASSQRVEPSPQTPQSTVHDGVQPSPPSHCSPACTRPLPQVSTKH